MKKAQIRIDGVTFTYDNGVIWVEGTFEPISDSYINNCDFVTKNSDRPRWIAQGTRESLEKSDAVIRIITSSPGCRMLI